MRPSMLEMIVASVNEGKVTFHGRPEDKLLQHACRAHVSMIGRRTLQLATIDALHGFLELV